MLKVLIIDDSKAVHAFVKDCVSKIKCECQQAFDGQQGLEVFKQKLTEPNFKYDLILLDWEMPKLTGPETLKELRKVSPDIPILMMTTRNSVDDLKAMLEAGVSEYMMKPFTPDIFFEKVETVLGRSVRGG